MKRVKLLLSLVGIVCLPMISGEMASAVQTKLWPYSWDHGLYATTSQYNDSVHAWGMRKSQGYWGTGPVNYQSGATAGDRANGYGSLDVTLRGTFCPNGSCSYGGGSGYKGLVQFWNDPNNFVAFGLIHDPGVSPVGTTLMIEGAAHGRAVGGYWPGNAIHGTSHQFHFDWQPDRITITIDNQITLGPYMMSMNNPSISFLAAARNTGDIADTTFTNINFSDGSIVAQPIQIPTSQPYASYSATLNTNGSGTGYSTNINMHDAHNNAVVAGVVVDKGMPETGGQPYYLWGRVQDGVFTFDPVAPAAPGDHLVELKWWKNENLAVLYADGQPIANIPLVMYPRLFFNAEGSARLNGDVLDGYIKNVQIAVGDNCPAYCGLNGSWNTSDFNSYGLRADNTNGLPRNGATFHTHGTVAGLPPGGDWDTHLVAGIGMIAQYWNGH